MNEILKEPLPESENYDTLGGLIFNITGSVPQEKEIIKYNNYDLIIEQVEGQRIGTVRIIHRKKEQEAMN